ncbi:MAG: hypothetical protein PHE20_03080 [Patescibacteria group bacterium]|nr:hypothetical protein [Patescibacteria group bacterium]
MKLEKLLDIQTDKLNKKLLRKIRFLLFFLVIMSGALIYETAISEISYIFILLGLIIGVATGIIVGRMFNIEWHEEKEEVIARLDIIGIIVLVLYLLVSIARQWIFAHWFAGIKLTAFTFSFAEGVMIGRIISFQFNIKKVLIKEGKLKKYTK